MPTKKIIFGGRGGAFVEKIPKDPNNQKGGKIVPGTNGIK